jgi:hypothetical protein
MSITSVARGINLVVETPRRVYFGRLSKTERGRVCLKRAAMAEVDEGAEREAFIRKTARYGFASQHDDLSFDEDCVVRVRPLGEVEKA